MRAKLVLFVVASLTMELALPTHIARAQDAATEEAREHFRKGQQFFDVGRWDEAATEFEQAYAVRSDPTFLFNMAQAYRRKGDAKRAVDLYKNYLIKAPKSPQRADVEERIKVLQKQLDEAEHTSKAPQPAGAIVPPAAAIIPPTATFVPAAPPEPAPATVTSPAPVSAEPAEPAVAPVPVPVPAPPSFPAVAPPPVLSQPPPPPTAQPAPTFVQAPATSAPPGQGLRVAGIIIGVTGLVAVAAGIFCGAEAKSYSDSVQSSSVFSPSSDDKGKLFQTMQWVGYGVGAGLVAAGAVLYGIGAAPASAPGVALAPSAWPGGAGVLARGVF